MSGTSGQRQTGTATVATGTATLAGLRAPVPAGHLATRNSSGFRMVGRRSVAAISECWTVAEPHYLAPRGTVATGGTSVPLVCHRPGVGAASGSPQPADRGWLRGIGSIRQREDRTGREAGDQRDRGDHRITENRGLEENAQYRGMTGKWRDHGGTNGGR